MTRKHRIALTLLAVAAYAALMVMICVPLPERAMMALYVNFVLIVCALAAVVLSTV